MERAAFNAEFVKFPKMARWSRDVLITEKIDGTSAQIYILDDGVTMFTGSRTRWVTPESDNHGFARWCQERKDELLKLGPGRHFGEWWGAGIQRRYGMKEKVFSLFNSLRWTDDVCPDCCRVVPILYHGPNVNGAIAGALDDLEMNGSKAAPGFMDPEGIVIYHIAAGVGFKKTIKGDESPKGGIRDQDGNVI